MKSSEAGIPLEHKRIEKIKGWTKSRLIGDDCARLPGGQLLTIDTLVQGTHFNLQTTNLVDLGFKAVAVNLSDVAAMAGRPRHIAVSLELPGDFDERSFYLLYRGMLECANAYHTEIAGGDLTASPHLAITVCVIGDEHERGCLFRSGARPGDIICVSGDFGASRAGLWALANQVPGFAYVKERHRRPRPRLKESWLLVSMTGGRGALMDASDGLADACIQIAGASNSGMEIDLGLLPVHEETRKAAALAFGDVPDFALYGGEDYELVACLDPEDWEKLKCLAVNPFVAIGKVTDTGLVVAKNQAGQVQKLDLRRTFQHW